MVNIRLIAILLLTGCGGEQFSDQRVGVAAGGASSETDGGTTLVGYDAGGALNDSGAVGGTGGVLRDSGGVVDSGVSDSGVALEDAGSGGAVTGTGGTGGRCLTDLSGVGTGDFRVTFTLTTTAHVNVSLLSQRIGCDQSSMLWSVSLSYTGQIAAATDDGMAAHWAATIEANSVADGKLHTIVFARTSGKIWISRDGVVDSVPVDDPYLLGALAPLQIGTDACSTSMGGNFWSAQKAGAVISNVCIE